jgi:hypothetical protein
MPSATRCADLIGDEFVQISRKARGALARYEDIREDRTAMVVQKSHENRKHVFSVALRL